MKKYTYLTAIILAVMLPNIIFAQTYPLQVIITQKQPKFTPFIGQFIENPGQYLSVRILQSGASAQSRNIYLKMRLQQLSPTTDISIISNLNTRPLQPISINPTGSTELTPSQIKDNFGNFGNSSDFELQGIKLSDYTDLGGSTRVPEGQYNLCITAYDFDAPFGSTVALSNPDMGCTVIRICYEASQPKWVMPMQSLVEGNCIKKQTEPKKIITMQWTPPMNTCGLNMAGTTYDLNIVRLINDQNEDDAIQNNPPVLRRENLNSTTFQIDTAMYPNMFVKGGIYAAQVTAKNNDKSIEFENNGKSPACSFVYGTLDTTEQDSTNKDKIPVQFAVSDIDCGVLLSNEKELIQTLVSGDEIGIGQYKMKISKVSKIGNGTFKGEGIVTNPGGTNFPNYNWVNVKVSFDTLTVNKDKIVIGGNAVGMYGNNNNFNEFFKNFNSSNKDAWYNKYFASAPQQCKSYVDEFTGHPVSPVTDANLLPIKIGDAYKSIAISSIAFSAKGAKMSMLYFLKDFENNIVIPFGISEVCADQSIKDINFELIKTTEVNVGKNTKLVLLKEINKITHIIFNKGYGGINLNAEVRIVTDKAQDASIVRVDGSTAPIIISISNKAIDFWEEWSATGLKIETEFRLNGFAGFAFTVPQAVYAHTQKGAVSDIFTKLCNDIKAKDDKFQSPAGGKFKGLFFEKLKMKIPEDFQVKKEIDFSAATFLSTNGFTMLAKATDVIDEQKTGVLGGWGFSMDEINLFIINNNFREANMKGRLWCPLGDKESKEGSMKYICQLTCDPKADTLGYCFNIDADNAKLKFLKYFTAELKQSSRLKVWKDTYGFAVKAWLDGDVKANITKPGDDKTTWISFTGISFKGLGIKNRDDKNNPVLCISTGYWGLGKDVGSSAPGDEETPQNQNKDEAINKEGNIGPFQLKIKVPTLGFSGGNITFDVGMDINLGFGDKTTVGASTSGQIMAKVNYDDKFLTPITISDVNFKLNEVTVKGEVGPVKLEGGLTWYDNDQTYGDGFRGAVKCKFPIGSSGIEVASVVQFGKIEDKQNYFFVDASLKLTPGIVIFPPYLDFTGFGGGVWKNMEISKPQKLVISTDEKNSDIAKAEDLHSIGQSRSGMIYKPTAIGDDAFGFNARVYFSANTAVGGPKLYNGIASLTVTTKGSSFESIGFTGEVNFIGNGKNEEEKDGGAGGHLANGKVSILYDHLKSEFDLYAGAKGKFMGVDFTVPFMLNITGDKWFIGLGIPKYDSDSIMSIVAEKNILEAVKGSIKLQTYICGGNNIPYPMPELPSKITEFLTPPVKQWPKSSAKGIMFGTRLELMFGLNFGPLYGSLDALMGCDLSLKEINGAFCGDGREIEGLYGYYGTGQVYGYIHGEIGVQIKIFRMEKKFSLCDLSAGAIIAGGMPNPTWMKGVFGVKGELLGGAIRFNTSAKFNIGKPCEIYTDPLKELKIVESITPGEKKIDDAEKKPKEEKPSVFTAVKIATNVKMNTPCNLYSEDSEGKQIPRMYIFQFERADIMKVSEGVPIPLKDNLTDKSVGYEFRLKAAKMLEPFTMYKVIVRVKIQENINGIYKNPMGVGKQYTDEECRRSDTLYFKTDAMPKEIVADNIVYAFPMNKQFETFVKKGEQGYIVLEHNQEYLIQNRETTAENGGLIGEFINRTDPKEKPTLFYYTYSSNVYSGKPGIKFDLKNLKPNNVYAINFYVIEKEQQQKDATFTKKDDTLAIVAIGKSSGKDWLKPRAGLGISKDFLGDIKAGINNPIDAWISKNIDSKINPNPVENNLNSIGSNNIHNVAQLKNVVTVSNISQLSGSFTPTATSFTPMGNAKPMMGTPQQAPNGGASNTSNLIGEFSLQASQSYIGINPNVLQQNFDISSITKVRDKFDTNKVTTLQNSFDETSKLVKEQSVLQSKMKNAKLTTIFNYTFHISRYNGIKEKMNEIKLSYTPYLDASNSTNPEEMNFYKTGNISWDCVVHLQGAENWANPPFRGIGGVTMPTQIAYMPTYTTAEEVFGGYAFSGTNAEYQPSMFQFLNEFPNDKSRDLWNELCVPFFNMMRGAGIANVANLPLRNLETVGNAPLSTGGYNSAVKQMNLYYDRYSSQAADYEGRLTDNEIKTGFINRPGKSNNKITHIYKNKIYAIHHILYASALASHIYNAGVNNNYFCNYNPNGDLTINDIMQINGYNAGFYLSANYQKIRENVPYFINDIYNARKPYLSALNCDATFNCSKIPWGVFCIQLLYSDVLNFSQDQKSNVFWLAWYWNQFSYMGYKDNNKFPELRGLKLSPHNVSINYFRLNAPWLLIKDVNMSGN